MAAGQRKDGESFKEYRERLSDQQKQVKDMQAGVLLWQPKQGTYKKAKHGQIGSR
mgnify:CR=1 FL=1